MNCTKIALERCTHIKCPKMKGRVFPFFPHKTLTVILLFISVSHRHQNTKALCRLQMAKQVVFGNTTACAALAMPWVFVNYKQFTKDSICLWLFRLFGTQKANLHTIHTPLHLQMWRQLLEGGQSTLLMKLLNTTAQALMKHNHAACRQKRCQNTQGTISKSTFVC